MSEIPTIDLKKFRPIGWYSQLGSNLVGGHYWGQCPQCNEECVFTPEGVPTAMHKTNKGEINE